MSMTDDACGDVGALVDNNPGVALEGDEVLQIRS